MMTCFEAADRYGASVGEDGEEKHQGAENSALKKGAVELDRLQDFGQDFLVAPQLQ